MHHRPAPAASIRTVALALAAAILTLALTGCQGHFTFDEQGERAGEVMASIASMAAQVDANTSLDEPQRAARLRYLYTALATVAQADTLRLELSEEPMTAAEHARFAQTLDTVTAHAMAMAIFPGRLDENGEPMGPQPVVDLDALRRRR
jgi:hypothetical protein